MNFKKIELNEQEQIILQHKLLNRSKLNENNKCLEWQFGKGTRGYGTVFFKRKTLMAHRASWLAFKGQIPEGLLVCHKCDNPPCINIDHLFLGTHSQNNDDMVAKGRWKRGTRKKTTINIKRYQMAFDISHELHRKIKILSATRNISMTLWIARAINDRIAKETQYDKKLEE